jgi:uncharacterized membrane protein
MSRVLIAYLATLAAMLAMDFIWLTATSGLYRHALGPLLLAQPNLGAAVAFYLVYVAGVVGLVVLPALKRREWPAVAWRAGGFGLVAYATYDLTNLATLRGFPVTIAGTDMAWGVVITALSASAGYAAARRVG